MNAVDIIIIVILLFFAIKGLICGLIKEVAGTVAIAIGLFASVRFSSWLAEFIREHEWFDPQYLEIICFVIIFLAVILLVIILSKFLNKFASAIKIQWLNKLAGLIFGTAKGFLIVGGICYLSNLITTKFDVEMLQIISDSKLYNALLNGFVSMFA